MYAAIDLAWVLVSSRVLAAFLVSFPEAVVGLGAWYTRSGMGQLGAGGGLVT